MFVSSFKGYYINVLKENLCDKLYVSIIKK